MNPNNRTKVDLAAIEGGLYEVNPVSEAARRIGHTGRRDVRALDFALVPR
jgi:hypothetical protein